MDAAPDADLMRRLARDLSAGDPLDKGREFLVHVAAGQARLFLDPRDRDLLFTQYQAARELARFLAGRLHLHGHFCDAVLATPHHFVVKGSLLSSLFTCGIAKKAGGFTDRDVVHLFVASFFKDLGMGGRPLEDHDDGEEAARGHEERSLELLAGTVPLKPHHQELIRNHHSLPLPPPFPGNRPKAATGLETIVLNLSDVIANRIVPRPSRGETRIVEALRTVKGIMAESHPREFKLIVSYFQAWFSAGPRAQDGP